MPLFTFLSPLLSQPSSICTCSLTRAALTTLPKFCPGWLHQVLCSFGIIKDAKVWPLMSSGGNQHNDVSRCPEDDLTAWRHQRSFARIPTG